MYLISDLLVYRHKVTGVERRRCCYKNDEDVQCKNPVLPCTNHCLRRILSLHGSQSQHVDLAPARDFVVVQVVIFRTQNEQNFTQLIQIFRKCMELQLPAISLCKRWLLIFIYQIPKLRSSSVTPLCGYQDIGLQGSTMRINHLHLWVFILAWELICKFTCLCTSKRLLNSDGHLAFIVFGQIVMWLCVVFLVFHWWKSLMVPDEDI